MDDDDMMMMIKTGVNGENALQSAISVFRRGVNETFALPKCYAAYIDSY
jgi:sialic acid synthase SpsE